MSSDRTSAPQVDPPAEPFFYIPAAGDGNGASNGSAVAWNLGNTPGTPTVEQREKEAFERGVIEGEARSRVVHEKHLAAANSAIATAIEKFKAERVAYFGRIEPEIVQLALAIARKILHREAQMDPLLLAGMVHVALEKADSATRVRLRANPLDIHFWNEYFAQSNSGKPAPELIGDAALQPGECALETEVGSTQISLETHLKEIEQGFFDLLEQRPPVR
jgi:flagellar assembly protein FliH